ncbi:MAG: DUF2490 domain-containing protein [Bacteroidota bacterium]
MNKILFLFLFLTSELLSGQKLPEDAWLWNTVSVNKQLSKKWSLGVDEELRLFDNMSRVNLFFTNVGVSYKLNRVFKFSLVYRFNNKNQDGEYYSTRHRLYLDIAYKKKVLRNLAVTYRVRFQGQVRDYFSSDVGKNIESYMRHKFDLSYSYKKYTPYLAAEFRFQISNPSFAEANDLWDRERFYLGCDYDFNKKHALGLYYMIQHDFNNQRAENDFTLGWQYTFSF